MALPLGTLLDVPGTPVAVAPDPVISSECCIVSTALTVAEVKDVESVRVASTETVPAGTDSKNGISAIAA